MTKYVSKNGIEFYNKQDCITYELCLANLDFISYIKQELSETSYLKVGVWFYLGDEVKDFSEIKLDPMCLKDGVSVEIADFDEAVYMDFDLQEFTIVNICEELKNDLEILTNLEKGDPQIEIHEHIIEFYETVIKLYVKYVEKLKQG